MFDEVTGDKALFVWDISHHHAMLNSKALELTGILADPNPVKGGIIHTDPGTGEPNGFVSERQISYMLERMPECTDDYRPHFPYIFPSACASAQPRPSSHFPRGIILIPDFSRARSSCNTSCMDSFGFSLSV